jgi:hypothetical protein
VLSLTLLAGEKIIIGGFAEKTLKNENGARLGTPDLLVVDINPIGLGETAINKY